MEKTVRPGRHVPLGATFDGEGVNFAVYSLTANGIELCLFDAHGNEDRAIPMREQTAHVWHCYVHGLRPGQRYGFRARGSYEPSRGLRFNPHKLLVDPYARSIEGKIDYREPVFPYTGSPFPGFAGTSEPPNEHSADLRDSARGVPKSVVVDNTFDWEGDRHPEVPWADTVLYEAHLRGTSMRHPEVPEHLRGTYLGFASEPIVQHLKALGVTTVELLPIHEAMNEWSTVARQKENYWGYSTLGFFAPDQRFAAVPGAQVTEFKEMVKRLHRAGLEVVLDVVYNHTGESDYLGPSVSLRGLDNVTYYRLRQDNAAAYEDFTGCGNSLDMTHPQTLKLVMDSLRYWVTEMHVDGFRFDLASTLARERGGVDKASGFFDIIHQDPILSNVKLIAEPWDLGQGGYQVGNFPVLWTEWNGRYRDTVRRFWTGNKDAVGDMGFRLTGSSDLYEDDGRRPHASINFITAHDGFTMRDLVSYHQKRNLANGEENRDGWDDNISWNCGAEGPTDDPAIRKLRLRQQRNLWLTLLLSLGVPMITAGDEIGKTQDGNNNAFVQDNEISWLDWALDDERRDFLGFCREVVAFRARHPVFRRPRFLRGERVAGSDLPDVMWFRVDGHEMKSEDWQAASRAVLAMMLDGDALDWRDAKGESVSDDSFLLLVNASHEDVVFTLPSADWAGRWAPCIDTTQPRLPPEPVALKKPAEVSKSTAGYQAASRVTLVAHSAILFKKTLPGRAGWRPSRSGVRGGF